MKLKSVYLSFFLLGLRALTSAQGVCFRPPDIYPGQDVYGICNADFNGDGYADLAVTQRSNSSVSILFGSALSMFSPAQTVSVGNSPEGIVAGDFNNDGKPDLAVANNGNSMVSLLMNNGTGNFSQFSMTPVGNAPKRLAAADFNGDGKLDIVVSCSGSSSFNVLLGDATGNFPGVSSYGVGGSVPIGICADDFNNDGFKDVAIANNSTNNISVRLGVGNGTFQPNNNYTLNNTVQGPYGIISTDLNNDGFADILVANDMNSTISVGLGNGTGAYNTGNNHSASSQPRSLAIGDFNKDGFKDVAAALYGTGQLAVYTGNGFGALLGPTTWPAGNNTRDIIVGDFDNNNLDDIATGDITPGEVDVFFNDKPMVSIAPVGPICQGDSVVLAASGANTYSWNTSQTTNTISVGPSSTTTYTVTGQTSGSCGFSTATVSVVVNALPAITASANPSAACAGTSMTLNGGGAQTYTWSNGVTDGVSFSAPSSPTTYTVMGTDGNGCVNSNTITVGVPLPATPNICMLTADSLALNNIIYWDKTLYPAADSFIVYRYDAFSSNYLAIGAAPKDSSHLIDTQRNIGGPNGGDPQYGSWQYKLAVKDTCGNISAKSPYHASVFVQENFQNFSWNAYAIEVGQANPVTGYSFLRDDNNVGAWHVLINTGGTSATDPAYSSFPLANWRVDALGFNCISNLRNINGAQASIVKSKSNIQNNRTTGVKSDLRKMVSLYPNPSNGTTKLGFIRAVSGNVTVEIFSALGEKVLSRAVTNPAGEIEIDLTPYESGMYFIKVIASNQAAILPVIKN